MSVYVAKFQFDSGSVQNLASIPGRTEDGWGLVKEAIQNYALVTLL